MKKQIESCSSYLFMYVCANVCLCVAGRGPRKQTSSYNLYNLLTCALTTNLCCLCGGVMLLNTGSVAQAQSVIARDVG